MATVNWKNAADGEWNTAVNWSNSLVPTAADDVTIGFGDATATFEVTEDAVSAAVASLKIEGDVGLTPETATLLMVGNTLSISTALVLSNQESIISGVGTLSVGGTISGKGEIIASDGLLSLTGAGSMLGTLVNLTIGSASASTLEIALLGGVAVSAGLINVSDADQTLKITNNLTVFGANEVITLGTVQMNGGIFDNQVSGITLSSGTMTGFGTVATGTGINNDFDGAGTVLATGGVLTFAGRASSGSATNYQIADVTGSGLQFNDQVGSTATVTFQDVGAFGGSGVLDLTGTTLANFQATVNTFIAGNGIKVLNADHVTLTGGTTLNVFDAANGSLGSINLGESHAGFTFFVDAATDTITTDMPCFAAGTRILTASGERMVQNLAVGDTVLTQADGELNAQAVKWIGRRKIERATHPRPETVAPVRIQRGAFGDKIPHSDLLLSPDHAIFVDGKLICARQLINGTTIRQETEWDFVEYFHVELDAHGILLSEGLPTESYLNTGNHGFFANADGPLQLHPDLTNETDYPTREAASCAPFVWDEASVKPVWQRLADRAATLGRPVALPETTVDPTLTIIAGGRKIRPLYNQNGLFIFTLPRETKEVRLVSLAAAPTDTRPWMEDRRRLGVYVERIILRNADDVRAIPVDHPALTQGWWSAERDGNALRRWTDGGAVVPLPATDGPTTLEVQIGTANLVYLVPVEEERRAA